MEEIKTSYNQNNLEKKKRTRQGNYYLIFQDILEL